MAEPPEVDVRETARRLTELTSSTEVGFYLRTINPPEFLYLNNGLREMLGVHKGAADPSFAEMLDRIEPADRAKLVTSAARTQAGGAQQTELRIRRLDGELRWVRISKYPVDNGNSAAVRSVGTVQDVTDRKLAQAAIVESDLRFRQLAGSLDVGISLRQIEPPTYLYVNPRYIDLIGVDPTALPQDHPVEQLETHIHPDDLQRVMSAALGAQSVRTVGSLRTPNDRQHRRYSLAPGDQPTHSQCGRIATGGRYRGGHYPVERVGILASRG